MGLHDLTCHVRRGDDKCSDLAKAEKHEGTILLRERGEREMRERAELVEVPYERKPWRGRGEIGLLGESSFGYA